MKTELLEQLARRIHPQSHLLNTWQLTGGSSAQMTVFEVLLPGGENPKLILRQRREAALVQNPQAVAHEFRLLKDLRLAGVAVPTPYYLDQSREILPTPYLVLEYVEGVADFAPADLESYVQQAAAQLIKIHSLNTSTLDLSYLPRQTSFAEKFQEAPANIDPSIHAPHIVQILKSGAHLPQINVPVLLHGDYWPGNILWNDGQLVAVIDWEDAALGDPLADLAISRLDMLMIFGRQVLQSFTRQYQAQISLDFANLPYWDLCAALRIAPYLADYGSGYSQLGRPDITAQTMQVSLEWFIAQAISALSP